MLSDRCLLSVCLSVCLSVRALWPNGWTDQDETCPAGRSRPGHIVLDEDPDIPQGAQPPISTHICCRQMAAWIKMSLGMELGLGPGDFVLDGAQPPHQKGAEPPPQYSAHFYCGQTAGCIKMPLSMDVGLSPGDFVLDGDPASPSQKETEPPPIFGLYLLWPNGWMDQAATAAWIKMPLGTEVGLGLRDVVFDVGPDTPEKKAHPPTQFLANVYCGQMAGWMKTPLGSEVDLGPGHVVLDGVSRKGHSSPPLFRPMSIVATVAHLSYC